MKRTIITLILVIAVIVIGLGGYLLWRSKQSQRVVISDKTVETIAPISVSYSSTARSGVDPTSSVWANATKMVVPLTAQVLFVPWGTGTTPSVEVRTMHDNRTLAFRLSWEDKTQNNKLVRMSDFPDGSAIMFPLQEGEPSSVMMGFLKPVNIWHWKASRHHQEWAKVYADFHVVAEKGTLLATHRTAFDHPPSGSDIVDNLATMPGTITPKKVQAVQGHARWVDGRWFVSYSRPLKTSRDEDIQFESGREFWTAFAVWDGERKERGSRKSIADWVHFILEEPRARK